MINKIVYENERGLSIELNHTGPLFIFKPEGFDGIQTEVVSNKGIYQDGININRNVLNERILTLNCYMVIDTEQQRAFLKNKLYSTFNSKAKGRLTVYANTLIRTAENVVVIQSPIFDDDYETSNELVPFQIQLMMPTPFFTSGEIGSEIATWYGGFSFKTKLPLKFKQKGDTKKKIFNEGHVDTPVKIYFEGPAVNPSIKNLTTNKLIKINRTIEAGEVLIINTEYGNKTVEIESNDTVLNAFHYLDLDSEFFSLIPGDNLIEYTTDNELDVQKVEIRYKERYLGV